MPGNDSPVAEMKPYRPEADPLVDISKYIKGGASAFTMDASLRSMSTRLRDDIAFRGGEIGGSLWLDVRTKSPAEVGERLFGRLLAIGYGLHQAMYVASTVAESAAEMLKQHSGSGISLVVIDIGRFEMSYSDFLRMGDINDFGFLQFDERVFLDTLSFIGFIGLYSDPVHPGREMPDVNPGILPGSSDDILGPDPEIVDPPPIGGGGLSKRYNEFNESYDIIRSDGTVVRQGLGGKQGRGSTTVKEQGNPSGVLPVDPEDDDLPEGDGEDKDDSGEDTDGLIWIPPGGPWVPPWDESEEALVLALSGIVQTWMQSCSVTSSSQPFLFFSFL